MENKLEFLVMHNENNVPISYVKINFIPFLNKTKIQP
jgi:hypothetical protein